MKKLNLPRKIIKKVIDILFFSSYNKLNKENINMENVKRYKYKSDIKDHIYENESVKVVNH